MPEFLFGFILIFLIATAIGVAGIIYLDPSRRWTREELDAAEHEAKKTRKLFGWGEKPKQNYEEITSRTQQRVEELREQGVYSFKPKSLTPKQVAALDRVRSEAALKSKSQGNPS